MNFREFFVTKGTGTNKLFPLPNKENPRIIVPITGFKEYCVGLKIHNVASIRNRILKHIVIIFYPFLKMRRSSHLFESQELSKLIEFVNSKLIDKKIYSLSSFIGTNSNSQKLTFQLMGKNRNIIGFLKISNTSSQQFIKNEYEIIRYLHTQEFKHIKLPNFLFISTYKNFLISCQNNIASKSSFVGIRLNFLLLNASLELARISLNYRNTERYLTDTLGKFRSLVDSISATDQLMSYKLDRYKCYLSKIPLVVVHGDFVSYNLRVNKKKLVLFDWEYARIDGIPLFDIFHFIFQGLFQINKMPINRIIDNNINASKNKKLYKYYLDTIGIDNKLVRILFELYLIESLIFDIHNNSPKKLMESHFFKGLLHLENSKVLFESTIH